MFWLLLFLICVPLTVYFERRGSYFSLPSLICVIVAVVLLILLIPRGMAVYPRLTGYLQEVKALQQRIDDIRSATYSEQPGKLVGGSLTNYKQSSKLSDYIRQVAEAEARYKALLAKARFYRKDFVWVVFGHGFFVSGKVFQLPELEGEKRDEQKGK